METETQRTEIAYAAQRPPPVDDGQLRRRFEQLADIGADAAGGWSRLAYSPSEQQARSLVISWLTDIGLRPSVDAAGNVRARYPVDAPGPVVLTGSHLDTVPNGGCWDGALGVVAGVQAVTALAISHTRLARPVEIIAFAAEESPRFEQAAYRFGSRALVGDVEPARVATLRDSGGVTLGAAMASVGLDVDDIHSARLNPGDVFAFVELHIDQGLTLANLGRPVGVVTAITGSHRAAVRVLGRSDHSGGARMADRRDALAGASEMVLAIERAALTGGDVVATVGVLTVDGAAISVVPGRVGFAYDLRSVDADALRELARTVNDGLDRIAGRRGLQLQVERIRTVEPIELDHRIRGEIHHFATSVAGGAPDVASHAGHDAGTLAPFVPTGMVFVRNKSGRSHSPAEDVDWPDAVAGAAVLTHTVHSLATDRLVARR